MYSFGGDYKSQLNDLIDLLFSDMKEVGIRNVPVEYRIKTVKEITDAYVKQTGERPAPHHLDRMSTYILTQDKFARKGEPMIDEGEYPVLSDRQYSERIKREASSVRYSNHDTRRVSQKTPTRTNRIKTELKTRKVK